MTKTEFMTALAAELNQRKIADSDDILDEYRQHFAFKLADGYTEEEIAAKLGDPIRLAAQFEPSDAPKSGDRRSSVLTWLWLAWADLFFGVFAALLIAFGLVLCACGLSFGLTGTTPFSGLYSSSAARIA